MSLNLGKIITGPLPKRDAIHIAVAPVVALFALHPGQHVGFDKHIAGKVSQDAPVKIGIVDPFLMRNVAAGEMFWMYLYPETVTGLRHEWTHPAFANDGVGVASADEKWLRDFADQVDADYDEMMYVASTHCGENRYGDYLIHGPKWEGQDTPDEFWDHYEAVTGKRPNGSPGIFSCSC